ncbi:MAG: sialate O-acetylesterase [Verrucomicrobia bacterium]|nr:sialate O-acetylesterase [Verrucomicrobiota bacterium]MDA1067881.1 sialate O-acetylesterase [Verrucomicrobiota bacterium]
MHYPIRVLFVFLSLLLGNSLLQAEVSLPSIFSDHMVLQRNRENPVWGWAKPGEEIEVEINGQSHSTKADAKGNWKVNLKPMPAGGPHKLEIEGEDNEFYYDDILVGEVWICSGQSNMAWTVANSYNAEVELLTANHPNIRLISVPQVGTQEAQKNFKGQWEVCTADVLENFSAVGYFFGRNLHQALDVPIGLIDNAWGGSAADAWIRRDVLEKDGRFDKMMAWWKDYEAKQDEANTMTKFEKELAAWRNNGRQGQQPQRPRGLMDGNQRPANIYNGVLHPTIGYGIRGAIWYQGESNAGRAYQYRDLFPLMIQHWRDEWNQGDFPFYYVQLADFREEEADPGDTDWAELREAQTMTMDRLSNVGEAVIIDVGEGRDIHPRDKQTVANRLSRWALANDYGFDILYKSPTYQSMETKGNKILLTFDSVGQGLYSFDTREPQGFAIAGADKKFVWAKATIVGTNQVEVWSDEVSKPVAVRYAWANNPVCTMYSREGLPMTPFRTDNWPGITMGVEHR